MIRIINGSTLIGGTLVSAGQTVSADAETEANLVVRGAAEYVGEEPAQKVTVPDETDEAAEEEFVSYEDMSAAELRALCDERGIAYKKNASAKALRALLEDGDMPVLNAADPVDA